MRKDARRRRKEPMRIVVDGFGANAGSKKEIRGPAIYMNGVEKTDNERQSEGAEKRRAWILGEHGHHWSACHCPLGVVLERYVQSE